MNIRIPQSGKAAKLVRAFLKGKGVDIPHQQCLELIAQLHGYQSWQAMESDTRFADKPALKPESSTEYELDPQSEVAWVRVDNISVYIKRNDEGVSVDLFAKGKEDTESLAGTWATFDESMDLSQEHSDAWILYDEKHDAWYYSLSPVAALGDPADVLKPNRRGLWWDGPYADHLDLIQALGKQFEAGFQTVWLRPDAPREATCHVFQDNGEVEERLPKQEALNKAKGLRDSGAGGTWTVETEDGELIAIFH